MAAPATAAMATVRIEPGKRSPMTISFCLELLLIKSFDDVNCPSKAWPTVSRFGSRANDDSVWRSRSNAAIDSLVGNESQPRRSRERAARYQQDQSRQRAPNVA